MTAKPKQTKAQAGQAGGNANSAAQQAARRANMAKARLAQARKLVAEMEKKP